MSDRANGARSRDRNHQVIDVVKQTCDVQQARLAAAAFGKLAAAFEQVRGVELVCSPDHPPDVLVWLILNPS